jgi:hypothetical protein
MPLQRCDLDYTDYINMSEEERNKFRDNLKNRIIAYEEKLLKAN